MSTGEEYQGDTDFHLNPEVEKLISEFQKEKSEPTTIVVEDNTFRYIQDDSTQGQLDRSIESLKRWGENPFNCNTQEHGKAFEVLTKITLEEIFKSNLIVRYSPSKLDFTPNKITDPSTDPSVDLIVGQIQEKSFEPIFFISTSLSKYETPSVFELFKTPIITLSGKDCLNGSEKTVLLELANTENINEFIKDKNKTYGKYFVNNILKDIFKIGRKNTDGVVSEKLKIINNILVNYKS